MQSLRRVWWAGESGERVVVRAAGVGLVDRQTLPAIEAEDLVGEGELAGGGVAETFLLAAPRRDVVAAPELVELRAVRGELGDRTEITS